MHRFYAAAIFLVALLIHPPAVAEVNLNGFASVVAGKVIEGDEFLADYPKTGIYDKDWSISPDTTLGLQFSSYFTDEFSLIAQVVVHGAQDFESEVDWLYVNYFITPELSVQFGRKRLPLYYYSDFFDVGYAYYWIRPPADLYTWQITNYEGISLLYEKGLGQWDASINVYYGKEESEDNDLLSELTPNATVDETWKDMIGIVGTMTNEWVDLRLTHMQGLVDRDVNGINFLQDEKQHFLGLSVNLTLDKVLVLSEFNEYEQPDNDVDVEAFMLSFGYQLGDFTPHITRSEFEQAPNALGEFEKHHTTTLGVRWDFYPNMALKAQFDKVVDEGVGLQIKGDSESVSLGLDFVF